MREISIAEAVREAMQEEMRRDPAVFLIGEDIGVFGGVFKCSLGMLQEFGPQRVVDTPISEAGYAGLGVGAAMTGLRPIVELMFCDFMCIAMDELVNQMAKMRYMSGGKIKVPMVLRTTMGAGRSSAAQHSQSLQAWIASVPGIKVVMPSTAYDAKGLLKSAIRDDNPIAVFEHKMMYTLKCPVPEEEYLVPIGVADVKRTGTDVTVVATSSMVVAALKAADTLQEEGISVEVVDPRTLVPLDRQTLRESARKTGHVVVVDEGYPRFSVTGELAAVVYEEAFDYLDSPVVRIGAADCPVPFSPVLEFASFPTADQIAQTIREMLQQ